ncbi:MAG: hypothetical protein OEY81_07965 [Candidatus Bathyarchaeota archaeon]|nr:hypothetical protein [Candidatus Bathyarchaeota archaeon]
MRKMDREEKEELDKAIGSFGVTLIVGLLYLMFGRDEWDYGFGVMWLCSAFYHLLRFRYAQYEYRFWIEEFTEWLIIVPFLIPGFILGFYFENPWIMSLGTIVGLTIWLALWKLYFEKRIHEFWW